MVPEYFLVHTFRVLRSQVTRLQDQAWDFRQFHFSLCVLYGILYAHLVSHLLFLVQNLFELKKWLEGLFSIAEKQLHRIFELLTLNDISIGLGHGLKLPGHLITLKKVRVMGIRF